MKNSHSVLGRERYDQPASRFHLLVHFTWVSSLGTEHSPPQTLGQVRRTQAQLLCRVHSCKAPQPLSPTSAPWARCSPAPKTDSSSPSHSHISKVCKTFPTIYYSLSGLSVLNASCSLRLESTALFIQPAKPYPLFERLKNSILCEAFFIPPTFSAPISGGSNT